MSNNPFAHLAPTPAEHFKLYFYAAVLHLLDQVFRSCGSREAALERFPFLVGYNDELAEAGLDGLNSDEAAGWWRDALYAWEETVAAHLPLRALRQAAGLDHNTLALLMCIGLIEEDARFGLVFETVQGTSRPHRLTMGLLNVWWRDDKSGNEVRANIRRLLELGLARVANTDAPRLEWALEIPGALWDALRGDEHETLASWAKYQPMDQLPALSEIILPDALQQRLAIIPGLITSGEAQALIVRGFQHNGRRTLLRAVARELNRGSLEISGAIQPNDERWQLIGPLATALHALPTVVLDLAPGETATLPRLNAYVGPLGIVVGKQGGVSGESVERALTLMVEMPNTDARRLHWQHACGAHAIDDLDAISERFRMTGGNIRRAAGLARAYAALNGHDAITLADVQEASRALNRQTLDTLAVRLQTCGDWNLLAVGTETQRELDNLDRRCRQRERLRDAVGAASGAQLNSGVRALFSGPSGTGKTLAARLLASVLQMDLYRLDLSSVVNKYIGETEKNLNQIFSRAEELDVILLLDEGDALLTQRTNVQTSNDRYANLETNFLLQRLESFEGILIVTTNAGERIDSAFQRRMDVVIAFRPPEVEERWAIWQLHLPPAHAVHSAFLEEVAQRCVLSGGQIRNVALHAALLALDDGGIITSEHLEAAIQREYHKIGTVCPLRRVGAASVHRN